MVNQGHFQNHNKSYHCVLSGKYIYIYEYIVY